MSALINLQLRNASRIFLSESVTVQLKRAAIRIFAISCQFVWRFRKWIFICMAQLLLLFLVAAQIMGNNQSSDYKNWIFAIVIQLVLITYAAHAKGQTMIFHSFQFDAVDDSPDVEVLDYRYGSDKLFATSADKYFVSIGRVFPRWSTSGVLPRGDMLYVKWRIKESGQIVEDTVDLKTRLPENIENFIIYFVIKGPQLNVYLISPEKRPATMSPGPLKKYAYLKHYQIYPD